MTSLCLDKRVEAELRAIPGNNICCDCDAKIPQWASVSFGIFMCLECSGRHRALGVHISFVRSVTMDSWSEKQIQMMRMGGNDKFNSFLSSHNVPKTMQIAQKYNTPAALFYRERLNAEVNGLPLPTKMPEVSPSSSQQNLQGSDPLPGESEADYVARQRRLQEEARERMRQKFGGSSGLNSSGKMQGIGSDPNYRAGGGSSSNMEWGGVDVNQIADVSTKAFGYFSSTLSTLGEQVVKTTQQLIDERNAANASAENGESASNKGGLIDAEALNNTWSSITWGAASLWKQATDVTSDLIQNITKEEEDFRFPRPPDASNKSSESSKPPLPARNNVDDLFQNDTSNHRSNKSSSSNNSWDSLSDVLNDPKTQSRSAKAPTGNDEDELNSAFCDVSINRGRVSPVTRVKDNTSPVVLSRNVSGGSINSDPQSPPRSNAGIAASGSRKVSGTSTPSTSSKKDPVGDDFFSTFGV